MNYSTSADRRDRQARIIAVEMRPSAAAQVVSDQHQIAGIEATMYPRLVSAAGVDKLVYIVVAWDTTIDEEVRKVGKVGEESRDGENIEGK